MKDKFLKKALAVFLVLFFVLFMTACATTDVQQAENEFSSEEEEDFLDEEESDDDLLTELDKPDEESTADETLQTEEKAAENELEDIEDEFAEFVEEEEEEEEEQEQPVEVAESEPQQEETVVSNDDPSEAVEESTMADVGVDQEVVDQEVSEPVESEPVAEDSSVDDSGVRVVDIRYENGQIFVDTVGGEVSYRSRFNEATRQMVLELEGAVIVDQLKWPYIMKEFQSSFALLQADQKTDNVVRIIVQMRPSVSAPSVVQKEDNSGLIVSGSVVDLTDSNSITAENSVDDETSLEDTMDDTALNDEEGGEVFSDSEDRGESQILHAETIYDFLLKEHKFYGNRITLDVRDAKLKDILYFLAEDTGINMIISENIPDTSKVNVRLKNIPWDQALILIMKRKQLAYVRKGSVITIATVQEFEQEQRRIEQLKQQQEASAPLKMEIIPISYAQASQLSAKISIFKTIKGRIETDNENNSLVIYDTESALVKMKSLIQELDRTPKQVMIAAKIVEVSDNFSKSFGVNWGFTSGDPLSFSIGAIGSLEVSSISPFNFLAGSTPNSDTIGSHLRIGTFPFLGDLEARFGIAENEGTVRVLSSPRIIALNGKSADVVQSTESISFTSNIGPGGASSTTVQKSPVSLNLSVTPNITNVNSIYMRVSMNRSFEGARQGQGESSAAPTNSRAANTEILVKSGQTAVIGGIYETQESDSLLGFPLLKYIPLVNWLFSQTIENKVKTELLLFLTPRIINIDDKMDVSESSV